jgi:hypothetical protein
MVDWNVLGVGRMKSVEQSCFSIGKKMMKGCWQRCFSNGKKNEKLLVMVFQQQKGKGETSAGRSCFGNENGEEMADWSVLVVVFQHRESVEQWCLSIGRKSTVLISGVSAS